MKQVFSARCGEHITETNRRALEEGAEYFQHNGNLYKATAPAPHAEDLFRDMGRRHGYGFGITVLAREWARRRDGKKEMAVWLRAFAEELEGEPE